MALLDDYLHRIEDHELPALRRQLEPLESGEIHLSERRGTEPWVDATPQWIDHLKKTIGIYEAILEKHRG